jgi:hypothetical protein
MALVKHPGATMAVHTAVAVSGAYTPKEFAVAIGEAAIHLQADGHTHLVGPAPDLCLKFAVSCCACNNHKRSSDLFGEFEAFVHHP